MKKITHIITDLNTGGAERMLHKLLGNMDTSLYESDVISLTDVGRLGKKIKERGIPVRALGMRSGRPNPFLVFRLSRWLRKERPDLIQTWMYHADLIGGLAAKLSGLSIPIVWGIRTSALDPKLSKKTTILTARASAFLSRWIPKKILCCSEEAKNAHVAMGYQ